MSSRWLIPLVASLLACPSPPEDGAEGGTNTTGTQAGGQQGPAGTGTTNGPAGQGGMDQGHMDQTTGTQCSKADPQKQATAAQFTQEALADVDHVTFSGMVTCDDCGETLVLRATEQFDPNSNPAEGELPEAITSLAVTAGATYSLLLPRSTSSMVMELVRDSNGDESATDGEWFGVNDGQGANSADQDRSGLDLNVTQCTDDAAPTAGAQNTAPTGPAPTDPPPPQNQGPAAGGDPPPPGQGPAGEPPAGQDSRDLVEQPPAG
jgi:hypothetical protein